MSVLINGIEMPHDCPMCSLSYWTWGNVFRGCNIVPGKRYAMDDPEYANSNKRPEWCPLVPVPEHGRLIDADAVENEAQKRMLVCGKNDNEFQKPYEIMRAITLAPTIIPADKEVYE